MTPPTPSPNPVVAEIETLIRARYPVIYIVTWEESRAETAIADIARRREKKVYTWSVTRGLVPQSASPQTRQGTDEATRDPLAALTMVLDSVDPAVFLFKDFHPYLNDPAVVRRLREVAHYLKDSYKTLFIVSPRLSLPMELEKDVSVVDFGLPGREELAALLESTVADVNRSAGLNITLTDTLRDAIVNSALGLTTSEAENAFAKALVETPGLDEDDVAIILREKEQIIRKSGMLEYYHTSERFEGVGGLEDLKEWLRKRRSAFSDEARRFGLPAPKGILLVGVQGCGKSLTAKALASLWRVPLLKFDMGRVFSSLVGSSEENIRRAIAVAESVAPAILWLDEIEKGFAGTQSSTFSDAGTTSRVFGTFITWLQEKTTPVFVVATANNISLLPPELLRKGRFDEIFFVDLPGREERKDIFRIHIERRGRDVSRFDLETLAEVSKGFSGAEIEQAVISALFDAFDRKAELDTSHVLKAVEETVPLSETMRENIDGLRDWAKNRARPASGGRIVSETTQVTGRRLEL